MLIRKDEYLVTLAVVVPSFGSDRVQELFARATERLSTANGSLIVYTQNQALTMCKFKLRIYI